MQKRVPTAISIVIVTIFTTIVAGFVGVAILKSSDTAGVYYSGIDSETSSLAKQNPNPGPTLSKQSKVFLWGGMQDNGQLTNNLNDVWVTTDMTNWQEFLPDGAMNSSLPRHSSFGSVYFDNKLWMIGGTNQNLTTGVKTLTNEVWSSTNGLNWVQVDANPSLPGIQNPPWSPRMLTNAVVVFNNKMWVVGGYTNLQPYYTVYSSPDGITWSYKSTIPASSFSGAKFAVEVINNNIIVTGSDSNNKVWYSADGINWSNTQNNTGPGASKFIGHTLKNYNGALYNLGGGHTFSTPTNQVWKSSFAPLTNNITWTQTIPNAGWQNRVGLKSIIFLGKLWVLGGTDTTPNGPPISLTSFNDVWYKDTNLSANVWHKIIFNPTNSPQNYPDAPWFARRDFGLVVVPASFGGPYN